jgi:hypothetical protein
LHIIKQFTRAFDLSTGSGIHFDEIDEPAFTYFDAGSTFSTRGRSYSLLTIEAFGEYTGKCSLAHTPGAGKQISMVQSLILEGVFQGSQDMRLSGNFGKIRRAPFPGEYLIAHREGSVKQAIFSKSTLAKAV